jgi:maleate cis-trans isomerase
MFRARENVQFECFTYHSSRMRMKKATKRKLETMDRFLA